MRLYPWPQLLLPRLDRVLVAFEWSAGGCPPGPAVPFQQPPYRRYRQAHPRTTADQRLDPDQGPAFVFEAVRSPSPAEFLLEQGESSSVEVGEFAGPAERKPPCRPHAWHDASVPPTGHAPAALSRSPRSPHPPRTFHRLEAGSPHETPDAQRSGPTLHPPDTSPHRHTAGIMNRHYPTTTRKLR